jgi:hypothetical protein
MEILKGGIPLPDQGYIEIFSFASVAQLPLEDVAVTVTDANDDALAMRLTDRNGLIERVQIPVPDISAGLTPDSGVIPYVTVNVYARKEGYEQVENKNIQLFPGIITRLNLEMIPLSELPSSWDKTVVYQTPSQNL